MMQWLMTFIKNYSLKKPVRSTLNKCGENTQLCLAMTYNRLSVEYIYTSRIDCSGFLMSLTISITEAHTMVKPPNHEIVVSALPRIKLADTEATIISDMVSRAAVGADNI